MEAACRSRILPQINFNQNYTRLRSDAKLISACKNSSQDAAYSISNSKTNRVARGLSMSPRRQEDFVGRTFCSAGVCTYPAEAIKSHSDTAEERIGVILLNLGGPDTLNDVQPFLFNLFADPDIIRLPRLFGFLQRPLAQLISVLRAPKSKEGYAAIGGGSPLRKITDEQASAIKLALQAKEVPANVYVAMRYWHPFTEEAVHQIKRDRITKLVVLPLYPQYSISTTGSSIRVLRDMFRNDAYLSRVPVAIIQSWYQREGYIKSMADLIEKELQTFPEPKEAMIFFSAHGVPVSYVENAGDPYKDQMEDCIFLIMQELKSRGISNDHTLAYQSRVGPVQWLKPYTDEVLVELGKQGVKSLLAVPVRYSFSLSLSLSLSVPHNDLLLPFLIIVFFLQLLMVHSGWMISTVISIYTFSTSVEIFVSEHIETLEEIDMEYRELALESGVVHWGRVPALNCTSSFITDMADAVIEALPSAMAISNPNAATEEDDNDLLGYGIKLVFGSILAFILLLFPRVISAFKN